MADALEAKTAYKRHQLPRRAEHAAYRNDIYLRWLADFDADRRSWGDLSDLDDDEKRLVVTSQPKHFSGESWEKYPYPVGYFFQRRGKESPRWRRKYERLYPDGHPVLKWADGLECAVEIEAERESWAREASRKVDRYAGYWLRLYREMESEWRAPESRPLEKNRRNWTLMEFREVDMERIGETLRYGAIEGALEDEIDELPAAFGYGGAEACA